MLDIATRIAFGPVLLAQANRLRRTALLLPGPPGPRRGQVGRGPCALRLLVAGDSSAAGVGAPTQRDALAWPLSEQLAGRLGGSVRWQLIAESGLTSEGLRQRLIGEPPGTGGGGGVVCGGTNNTP